MDRMSLAPWIVLLFFHATRAQQYLVETTAGKVRGTLDQQGSLLNRNPIISFRNIPYAKPPVGQLRFKPPQAAEKWSGTLEVRNTRIFCPQILARKAEDTNVTEDCLLLDVYVSKLPSGNDPRAVPVIVYLHGGQFVNGSKDMYGPKYLLDKTLVVVIVNYRLGVLGFLSTNDKEVPGNLGFRDQLLALQWVKDNIRNFGGNPDKVTIVGHDSGAVAVSLHILSPLSKGLFSRAISSGGNALMQWAILKNPLESAEALAQHLGCSIHNTAALVSCLRSKTTDELLAASSTNKLSFGAVVDLGSSQPFLPADPRQLYENKQFNAVPYMSGVTKNEGSLTFYAHYREAKQQTGEDSFISLYLGPLVENKNNFNSIVKATKYQYFSTKNYVDLDTASEPLIDMISDIWIKSSNDMAMKMHSQLVESTYMYVFSFRGTRSFGNLASVDGIPSNKYGVAHMDDVFYMFNTSFDTQAKVGDDDYLDKRMVEVICNFITKFAENGNPSIYQGQWEKYSSRAHYFLEFLSSEKSNLSTGYRQSEMDFWNVFVPDLQAVENSTSELPDSFTDNNNNSTTYVLVAVVMILIVLCVCLVAVVLVSRSKSTRLARLTNGSSHDMSQEKM